MPERAMPMRVLVAGASGQLARALLGRVRRQTDAIVIALGRPQLDLLDRTSIARAIETAAPHVVINAAAYTAVDKAEFDAPAAFALNRDGAGALAAAAAAADRPIIHLSTDYVFDGRKPVAYVEHDAPNPTGV